MMKGPSVSIVFMFLSVLVLTAAGSMGSVSYSHWSPEEPVAGEQIDIIFILDHPGFGPPDRIRVNISGEIRTPRAMDNTGNLSYTMYSINHTFTREGNHEVSVETYLNGTWYIKGDFMVEVSPEERDDKGRTILGLPSWYCSVSVIFLTLVVIFLTWSYFKGRSMVKERKRDGPVHTSVCSECGKPVSMSESRCRWCGSPMEENEYVCGRCGSVVQGEDDICGKCGCRLSSTVSGSSNMKRSSTGRKRGSFREKILVEEKGKRRCDRCGTVLMKDERVCPICNR